MTESEQIKVIEAKINFVEKIKKIAATKTMSKPKKIKDRKLVFDTEHAKFDDDYTDALDMLESIEKVRAD